MNTFDKVCAATAFPIGLVFLALGIIGVFTGCKANFSLPPILGALPAFVGWGIVRSIYFAWNRPGLPKLSPDKHACLDDSRP